MQPSMMLQVTFTRAATLTTTILLVLFSVVATSAYFLMTKRRRTPNLALNPDELPEVHQSLRFLAGATKSVIHPGNQAEIFQDGALFPAMIKSIEAAQGTVHFESFVWTKGELERQFVDVFYAKAKAGVKVRVLLDAIGAMDADPEQLARLRAGGVDVRQYCRAHWWNLRRFNHRTHRKLLIVDGRVGFVFGHGIADQWLGEGQDQDHWRDTGVRIAGPAVQSFQSVFLENWIEETETVPTEDSCFPEIQEQGSVTAHVVSSATGEALSSVALLYTLAIACARKEIIIQNPYFAPEKAVVTLLGQMVKRGVEVHVMVPGKRTDNPFVRRAGCSLYLPMLQAGVRLYEFNRTLIHQKVVVVDGAWVHVGSTNFDARSLALNEEVGVGLLDSTLARQLKAAFEKDLEGSNEILLEKWLKRRWYTRFIDWFAYLLRDQI